MLRDIVNLTQLDPKFCASLFGVAPDQFDEWMSGARPIPRFLLPEVASVFGATPAEAAIQNGAGTDFAPAIWYKVRTQEHFSAADLEIVGLIRKLSFGFSGLQKLTGKDSGAYEAVFEKVRTAVSQSASIRSQARTAADVMRASLGWEHGKVGIGEFIRPNLRSIGLVIVESPFADTQIEGCSFRVKTERDVPCIFANSYQSTWFRRNAVILHEVCHNIFDLEGDPVSIDYKHESSDELREKRANLFAQECLVPATVLTHLTNSLGVKWDALSAEDLARLMTHVHVEQKLLLSAALDADLITADEYDVYLAYECGDLLKQVSEHALSTPEFFSKYPNKDQRSLIENRFVKIGNRKLLLPAGYVKGILDLLVAGRITVTRAAELAMMNS